MSERSDSVRLAGWLALVGALSALSFANRFSGEKPPRDAVFRYDTAVSELVLFAIVLALVLLIARGRSKRTMFALRRPLSWRHAAGLAFLVLVVVLVAGGALDQVLHASKEQGLAPTRWRPDRAGQFAANFAALACFGPIVEELTFRGLGFTLLARFGRLAAVVLNGVAFGLWHGLVDALPALTLFGIGLAYLRSRTESVYPTIALHAFFNAFVLTAAVAT